MISFVILQLLVLLVQNGLSCDYADVLKGKKSAAFLCKDAETASVKLSNSNPKLKSANYVMACENKDLTISCCSDKVINIVEAAYGRDDMTTCEKYEHFTTYCAASDSLNKLKQRCQNKRSCTIRANNSEFGKECGEDYVKYLKVKYTCEQMKGVQGKLNALEEGRVNNVACEEGTYIAITAGWYGADKCFQPYAVDVLMALCEYKQKCTVSSSKATFGDPCPDKKETLNFEYQCVPETTKHERVCEHHTAKMTCKDELTIDVISADFGVSHPFICQNQGIKNPLIHVDCHSVNVLEIVKKKCQGKKDCEVKASTENFKDACVGHTKYLELEYDCVGTAEKPVSPGAPFIINADEHTATFQITGINAKDANLYKVQYKDADKDAWDDFPNVDFNEENTIRHLAPGKLYDVRVVLNDGESAKCIPSTRFITKKN